MKSFLLALSLLLVAATAQAQSYLGHTTIGAGEDNGGNANYLVGSQFTAAAAGSITSGSLYITPGTSSGHNWEIALYDSTGAGGGPGNLLAYTPSQAEVGGWNTANVVSPVTVSAGTSYWIIWQTTGGGTQHDPGSQIYKALTYGAFPTTLPSGWNTYPSVYSAYFTVATTNPVTGCLKGSAYADGCSGAAAGSPQLPTILQGYATRPPWNVAGVDYPVGVPAGTSLKDPTTAALPTGCSFSGSTVTCSGSTPITLNGYDFSLHNGTTLSISAANITVQNSKFVVGTNQGSLGRIVNVTGSGNVTFLNNEFDGASIPVTAQAGQTINIANVGTITFKYNYFHNSGGDMIDLTGGPQVNVLQYNMWRDIGVNTAHADTIQWYNSKISAGSDIGFNTVYQSVNQPGPGNGLLVALSEGPTATMTGMMINNNTLISLAACSTCNWGMGFYADLGGIADHVAIHNNYIDPTGINLYTASPWLPTASGGTNLAHPMAMFGLTNMVTGASIPVPSASHKTSQGYYVYPDASGYSPALSDIYTTQASPSSGTVSAGGTITFTLNMDEPWTVTGTPTFSLNSGGTASYSGGSGTNTLTFTYTVRVGDSATNLTITAVNLNGATIKDAVGNSANLTGAVTTFNGLNVLGAASQVPSNTALPTITGTAQVGQTLTSSTGSWSNSPTSYAYQWYGNGTVISGATQSTYVPVVSDVSHTITVAVTATNASGSSSATSAATAPIVAAAAPSNTALPTITGTAQVGQTLTSSTGTWSNSPTSYSYQWYGNGVAISGATSSSYVPVTGDIGHTISVAVTAANSKGSSSPATSAATAAVIAASTIPVNSALPVISGTAQEGQTLTTTNGTWTQAPTSYAYQWYDSDTGSAISGATSSTYVLQASDVGHQIKVSVTATNTAGSSSPAMSACL